VYGLDPAYIDPVSITLKVIQGVYSGVTTSELDELAAQTGASKSNTLKSIHSCSAVRVLPGVAGHALTEVEGTSSSP
jgi:hypothetical protein